MPHVLTAAELPVAELLRRAEAWRTRLQANPTPPIQPRAALIALLFYEPSTRTRAAFEQASVLLGYHRTRTRHAQLAPRLQHHPTTHCPRRKTTDEPHRQG